MHKLLVLVACVAACDDSIPIEELPDEIRDAQCEFAVRCQLIEDAQTCRAVTGFTGNVFETIIAGVDDGTIDYDADAARECVDAFADRSCEFPGFHDSNPCDDVFDGTVAAGGACFVDEECANDGNCRPTQTGCDRDIACCPGTCEAVPALVAIGGTCDATSSCVDTAYCKRPMGQPTGTCTALIAEGAACDELDACADPMFCDLLGGGSMTCKRPAASGATCSRMHLVPCLDIRDYCDATALVCVRRVGVGESCSAGTPCVGYASCQAMSCVADLEVGAACMANGADCAGSLACVNGTCTAPPAGMACR
jgi:hypothetical protein